MAAQTVKGTLSEQTVTTDSGGYAVLNGVANGHTIDFVFVSPVTNAGAVKGWQTGANQVKVRCWRSNSDQLLEVVNAEQVTFSLLVTGT